MKILHIITKFNEMYGAQRHAAECIKNHINNGHTCMVMAGEIGNVSSMVEAIGCKVSNNVYLRNTYNIFTVIKAITQTVDVLNTFKPDLVIAHSSQGGIVARIACYKNKVPNMFTVQGWIFERGTPWYQRFAGLLIEWGLKFISDSYWCVSQYTADYGIKMLGLKNTDRIYVCGNMHEKEDNNESKPFKVYNNVLMVAGFRTQKDHTSAIKALAIIIEENKLPHIHFTFVGEGPKRKKVEQQIKKASLEKYITLTGQVQNVEEYYETCDIVILPTYYEGLPLSLIEAVQKSKPVIATDVAGNKEIVHDGFNGNLIAVEDFAALAAYITDYYVNNKLELLSAHSKEVYSTYFTYDKISEQLNYIINDTVKKSVFAKGKVRSLF